MYNGKWVFQHDLAIEIIALGVNGEHAIVTPTNSDWAEINVGGANKNCPREVQ